MADEALQARQQLDAAIAHQLEIGWKPACAGEPEAWFSLDAATIVEAATACQSCRVWAQCATYAIADPQTAANGVWAGRLDRHQDEIVQRAGMAVSGGLIVDSLAFAQIPRPQVSKSVSEVVS